MKAKTVILSNLDVSVFSFTKERKRNLTIQNLAARSSQLATQK